MVHLNGFSVRVEAPNAKKVKGAQGSTYIAMPNKSEYSLKLTNERETECDVVVNIDGEFVGKWRINAGQTIEVERPTNVAKKFTFFEETSKEAKSAGVAIEKEENGLVDVVFYPRKFKYVKIKAKASTPKARSMWFSTRKDDCFDDSQDDDMGGLEDLRT